MRYLTALAMTFAMLTFAGCQKAGDDTTADTIAVRATASSWAAAYNAGDVDKLTALYWDDAVLQPPGVPAAKGRDAIRAYLAGDVATAKSAGLTVEMPDSGALTVSGNLAFDAGNFTATDASGATVDTGKYLSVFQKRDGKWLFIRDTWNSDSAPAAAPAEPATEATSGAAT